MSKFKVGDTVTIGCDSTNEVYTICSVDDTKLYCNTFTSPSGHTGAWEDEGLTLVEPYTTGEQQHNPVSKPSYYNVADGIECVSDGGPSAYYDFHSGWSTWNDFADYKASKQWKEHAFHLGNIGKVLCRWGDKSGTTKSYDARKVVYSGLRVLLMLEGKESVRTYLESLLEDGQFKELPDE